MAYDDWESDESDLIEDSAEDLLDNDEVSAEEEGFMKGYSDAEEESDEESSDDDESEEEQLI
ncbi:hypothetical protein JXM83_00625 [Candidatus Woesearchaeota archaeon]|nr:hypothetical protein [Candidatus Woesearchaeota archaeon]